VAPLRRVLARDPSDAGAALELARAYREMGFLGRAAELYSGLAPAGSRARPEVLREYLRCLLELRDWANAAALAARGAAAEPGDHFWPLSAARALAGQGRYAEAAEKAAEAEALSKSPQRRLERALYLLLAGRGEEAAAAAEAELRAGPSQLASFIRGMALYTSGNYAGSEPFFRDAGGENFTGRLAGAFLRGAAGEAPCVK
jgi:tetratricopeptide (TPR) repeat protein